MPATDNCATVGRTVEDSDGITESKTDVTEVAFGLMLMLSWPVEAKVPGCVGEEAFSVSDALADSSVEVVVAPVRVTWLLG